MAGRVRPGLVRSLALLVAVASSVGFAVAGFLVPVYDGVTVTSESPAVRQTSSTLVAENGSWVVALLVLPLVATVVVALALLVGGRPNGLVIAWSATAAVALFTVLAMLTIGIFALPGTIALVVACADATATHRATRSAVPAGP
jgi:hypothetical protein